MLRLSKLTDYAVVVMVQLSRQSRDVGRGDAGRVGGGVGGGGVGGVPGAVTTAPVLAQATGIPEPTVAKVLKALAASGLVASQRGARGGYRLARTLDLVPVAEVIAAIDGPISMTACVDGATGGCEAQQCCPIRGRWDPVNDAIRETLGRITLDSMDKAAPGPQMPGAPRLARANQLPQDARDAVPASVAV